MIDLKFTKKEPGCPLRGLYAPPRSTNAWYDLLDLCSDGEDKLRAPRAGVHGKQRLSSQHKTNKKVNEELMFRIL